jgi:hypothetical protein
MEREDCRASGTLIANYGKLSHITGQQRAAQSWQHGRPARPAIRIRFIQGKS